MRLRLFGICINRSSLARQIVFDGFAKTPVHDVVRGPGDRRFKSTTELVLALRSRLKPRHTLLDTKLDSLVIAGFEMQAVVIRGGAPVAAKQRLLGPEKDRRGHWCATTHSQFDHERITHR